MIGKRNRRKTYLTGLRSLMLRVKTEGEIVEIINREGIIQVGIMEGDSMIIREIEASTDDFDS
jgi:hypothetical protein